MNKEAILNFYNSHRGEINGAVIGAVFAIIVLLIGIFRTLFIALCAGLGYYIGKRLSQDKDYIKKLLDKILPPGTYR